MFSRRGTYPTPPRQSAGPSAKTRRYEAFLKLHPGLKEALMIDHRISSDLDVKVHTYGSISPAQIALAFKLHADLWTPARPSETHVAAPEGRQTFRGIVVSLKEHDGQFGLTWKMTVKVTTDAGTWLAWGTVPSGLNADKGDTVELTGTLARGNEAHFAFFKRPTHAWVVTAAERAPAPTARRSCAMGPCDGVPQSDQAMCPSHLAGRGGVYNGGLPATADGGPDPRAATVVAAPVAAPAPAPEHRNAAALRELAKLEAMGADPRIVAQARAALGGGASQT